MCGVRADARIYVGLDLSRGAKRSGEKIGKLILRTRLVLRGLCANTVFP
jgi:hypothetical protein